MALTGFIDLALVIGHSLYIAIHNVEGRKYLLFAFFYFGGLIMSITDEVKGAEDLTFIHP